MLSETIPELRFYRRLFIGFAYVAGYVALDYVSFLEAYRSLAITPWNPPPGLTVSLVFFGGAFYAPFVLAAPLAADLVVRSTQLPLWFMVTSSMVIGGVYLAAGLVLRKLIIDARFHTVRDVIGLIAVAAGAAAAASFAYVALLWAVGFIADEEIAPAAWRYLIGDFIGILVLTPIVLLITTRRNWPRPTWEHLLQLVTVGAVLVFIFQEPASTIQLFYLLFLPVIWIALRHGIAGSIAAVGFTQIGLVGIAELRFGEFGGLTALQALMTTLATTGLLVGAAVTEREIAAQRLLNQQLALDRALRLRSSGETAAAIAHEINQPITALGTYAMIAEDAIECGDGCLAKDSIRKLRMEAERAGSVLDSIRGLFRHARVKREQINLEALLVDTRSLLSVRLATNHIRLSIEVGEDILLQADRTQLQQAINNLINNSIEAVHNHAKSGTIKVSAKRLEDASIVIEVSDSGPGFPSGFDMLATTPFTSTKAGGSGLGLAIARSVAEAHGGSLSLQSSFRGAVVQLRLPSANKTDAHDCIDH